MNRHPQLAILIMLGLAHCLNDVLQSLVVACYPLIKEDLQLSYAQIGLITMAYQATASLLQPLFGYFLDKRPWPYHLFICMTTASIGLFLLSSASSFIAVIIAVMLFGVGSSLFHPEGSRMAHLAAQGKRSTAQAIFQVGGNLGTSIGPLLMALVISTRTDLHYGLVFCILGYFVAFNIARWLKGIPKSPVKLDALGKREMPAKPLSTARTSWVMGLLMLLIFSKFCYMENMRSYYTFYLMEEYGLSVSAAQLSLFVFLAGCAIGTLAGGPMGDKWGRDRIIWFSILGAAPFAALAPHAGLWGGLMLSFCGSMMISSAFPAIVVYAQELLPGRLSLVSGLFFGIAFGISGLCSGLIGALIDRFGLMSMMTICGLTPLLGCIAVFLPKLKPAKC